MECSIDDGFLDFFAGLFDIAARAMSAQMVRLNTSASNLASSSVTPS